MDEQALKYFRDELNQLRTRVERNETKLGYVEDASKGSLSTREARAETFAFIKADIRNLFEEVGKLQTAKEKLDDRFFHVWCGVGLTIFGIAATAIFAIAK